MISKKRDEHFLKMALDLARKSMCKTAPNPMVGAVLVKGDKVVGADYHRRAGGPHAEILAIKKAGKLANGAELFLNLEPCNHEGKTGPCVRAIIDAKISRVVVGMIDPNPLVNGKGIRALKRAGISVTCGVLSDACWELNQAFIIHITKHRPMVTFKTAITLDGRVAGRDGNSKWVTSKEARKEGHRLRSIHQAIVVGVGTVLADDPKLTCRDIKSGSDPIRIIVDSKLRTPLSAKVITICSRSKAPTWILTTKEAPISRIKKLEKAGARVVCIKANRGQVDIKAALEFLAKEEFVSLLLEGGPTLAGAFWRAKFVDQIVAFVAPKILGDPEGLPMVFGNPTKMSQATKLTEINFRRIGEDFMICGRPVAKRGN